MKAQLTAFFCFLFIGMATHAFGQLIGGKAYMSLGQQMLSVQKLNDELADQGYNKFPETLNTFGVGADIRLKKWVWGAEAVLLQEAQTKTPEYELALDAAYGLVNVGYAFYHNPIQTVYPYFGVGVASMQMDISPKKSVEFDELLETPNRGGSARAVGPLLNLGLGVDYLWEWGKTQVSRGGLNFGFRAGYLMSFLDQWHLGGTSLKGMPDTQLSGFYLKLIVGFGGDVFSPVNPAPLPL